jgi:hypothetical protein
MYQDEMIDLFDTANFVQKNHIKYSPDGFQKVSPPTTQSSIIIPENS